MATATSYILLIIFITTPFYSSSSFELTDDSFISMLISQTGLDFLKQLLVNNAIASVTPLQLPQIEKTVKIPFLGQIHIVLSNITIYHVDVPSSYIKPGDTGIAIVGSGTSCNLSMNWHYSYGTWLVPVSISDSGRASVLNSQSMVTCTDSPKMLGISLDEAVFNSASSLYYNAEFMLWTVDTLPDQAMLNTAWWRFLIPQLYKKFPNDDMKLNISLSAPPVVRISPHGISATVYADLIIDVLEGGDVVPVVCISLVIRGSGSVKVVQNNLAGSLQLDDFTMQLKWSQIGKLRMYLIQPVVWTLIETVCLPYANSHLGKGFPLPIIHGFTLQNAEIVFSDSTVTVCSDVTFTDSYNLSRSLGHPNKWTQELL